MAKEKKAAKPKKEPKAKKPAKAPKGKKAAKGKGEAQSAPPISTVPPAGAAAPDDAAELDEELSAKQSTALLRKKRGKVLSIVLLAVLAVGAFFLVRMAIHEADYKSAQRAIEKGNYQAAQQSLEGFGDYKDARVLRNYALARWLYSEGISTNGAVLDQVVTCLDAIPADYSGAMASEIVQFKKELVSYHRVWTSYKNSEVQSDDGSTVGAGASVKHRGNFYTAFKEFYESAAHFWDEDAS